MINTVAITLLFGLTLSMWRLCYPHSYWAIVAIIPLWTIVFAGTYQNSLEKHRALMLATLRTTSKPMLLFNGRVTSALSAFFISSASVSVVVLSSQFSTVTQLLAILFLTAASVLMHSASRKLLHLSVQPLALSWVSASAAIILTTSVFIIPFAVFEWTLVERPGYIRLSFDEAMSASLAQLPRRNDALNEAVSIFQVIAATKLWLASRFTGTAIPGVLYAVQSALICTAITASAVGASSLYQRHMSKESFNIPERK